MTFEFRALSSSENFRLPEVLLDAPDVHLQVCLEVLASSDHTDRCDSKTATLFYCKHEEIKFKTVQIILLKASQGYILKNHLNQTCFDR